MSHLIERLRESLSSAGEPPVTKSWPAAAMPAPGERDSAGGADGEAPATRTGRYRLLRQVGAGGRGTVYLAEDPDLGRSVALKLPHFTGSSEAQEQARQRFLREARAAAAAAAAMRHAHVCPIYNVGVQDGTPFVVMAYIEGCSLAPRLQRDGQFTDVRAAVALAVQMATLYQFFLLLLPRGGRIADTIGPDAGRAVTPHW